MREQYLKLNDFRQVVDILKEYLEKGLVELEFTPYGAGCRIRDEKLEERLKLHNLDKKIFNQGIKEILEYLTKIIKDPNKKFIENLPEQEQQDVQEKCRLIESSILTNELRDKYLFQIICKSPRLSKFDWDIIEYKGKNRDLSVRAVVLSFTLRDPFIEPDCPISTRTITFECTKYDIEKIIKELEKIKRWFDELEHME